jgi:type I restriction enzyme, S subunit
MASKWQKLTVDALKAEGGAAIAIGPFGSRMKADRYVSTGVPVIRGNNLSDTRAFVGDFVYVSAETADELGNCNVYREDLVFPHRGAIGEVGIVPDDGPDRYVLSTSLMKLTCNRKLVDPLFLFYFFRSPVGRYELLKNASTVGTPGIGQPLASLRSIEVLLPPMGEQRDIVETLRKLDDKIELNRRMNRTLEGMARALFKSWFVDFDPVRAKAEGREPFLPKPLAELFPESMQDSEMGEIPAGWRMGNVANIAEINGRTLGRNDHLDVIDYIEISEVMRGDIDRVVRYERGSEPSRARRRLSHGDAVLSSVRPDRGAHFLALNPPETLVASTGFVVLTPRDDNWAFLYSSVTRQEVSLQLGRFADGGAYPAIRPEVVGQISLALPAAPDTVALFERLVRPLYEKSAQNRRQSRALGELRDALLPKLTSGELRIPDAERIVEGRQD